MNFNSRQAYFIFGFLLIVFSIFVKVIWFSDIHYLFEDDLFYYVKIVENVYHYGEISYNGIVPTNGFQPLYFVILLIIYFIAGGTVSPIFYLLLMGFITAALIVFFVLIYSLLKEFEIKNGFRRLIAIYVLFGTILLSFRGMEIFLVLLFGFLTIYFIRIKRNELDSPKTLFTLGFFSAITIFARIDAAVLIGLIALIVLPDFSSGKRTFLRFFFFGFGFLPFALYIVGNLIIFDLPLPVSGYAKQAGGDFPKNFYFFANFFQGSAIGVMLAYPTVFAIAVGLLLFIFRKIWGRLQIALILFPILLFLYFGLTYSYGIFHWYFYPLLFGAFPFFEFIAKLEFSHKNHVLISKVVNVLTVFIFLTSFAYFAYFYSTKYPDSYNNYKFPETAAKFSYANNGIYAMGEGAGKFGLLSDVPIIQLEGLVMDKYFLHFLENQTPLLKTLSFYKVDYLVAKDFKETDDGKYLVISPRNFYPMIDTISWKPSLVFDNGITHFLIFPVSEKAKSNYTTTIFVQQ